MSETSVQGRSGRNGFAALDLERCTERRGDAEWIAGQLADPRALFVPVWGERSLVAGEPPRAVKLARREAGDLLDRARSTVFLGRAEGRSYFALGLEEEEASRGQEGAAHGRLVGLRRVAPLLGEADAALLAYARAMATWHRATGYCSHCGSPTESGNAGFVRRCTGPTCGREHFPRTDPAIIVLVHRGERCLLGRQAWWEPNRFSVIAGFVEPGESFEAAVAREVAEETAVQVAEVRYRSSQPWPFPSGIMVGFSARGASEEILLCDKELEEARWFSREELSCAIRSGAVGLPYRVSIAFRLIEEWFDAEPGWRLAEEVARSPSP